MKLYTVNQACEMLQVTRPTLYLWMREGRLDYVMVGPRRRITEEALNNFIKAKSDQKTEGDTQEAE